jgi:hypothetical protein
MHTMDRASHEAPQIVSAEDLLAKMRAGTKEVYDIRLRELVVPVRILTIDERQAIRREAIQKTAMAQGDETDKNVLIQKFTLKLASTIQKNGAPMLSDKLLSMLSLDEIQYLYDDYMRVTDSVNPNVETISPEKFRELVDALKKSLISSKDCSLLELRAICSAFVALILKLESQDSPTDS